MRREISITIAFEEMAKIELRFRFLCRPLLSPRAGPIVCLQSCGRLIIWFSSRPPAESGSYNGRSHAVLMSLPTSAHPLGCRLDEMMFHGRRGREISPPEGRLAAVQAVKCSDLVDAMGRRHRHRCHMLDLISPTPGRKLFGPAVTISYFPTCSAALDPERYNFANLFYEAVGDSPAGKVLVLASNGYTQVSMGGGTKLFRLQQQGLAGLLTDGRLRDFDELTRYEFAAYCSGQATRWGGDQITPFQANVPVVVGGVGVMPGQFIYADASGAVVVPEDEIDEVLTEAGKVEAQDEDFRNQISREKLGPGKARPR